MAPKRKLAVSVLAFVLCFAAASLTALAQSAGEVSNIRVTIEVGRMSAGKKDSVNTYSIISPSDGTKTELGFGSRVPIPISSSTTAVSDDGKPVPMTSFSFQNVGMTLNVRTTAVSAKQIKLVGSVEASIVQQENSRGVSAEPPVIGSLRQDLSLVLKPGSVLRAVTIDDQREGALYLDVKADYVN